MAPDLAADGYTVLPGFADGDDVAFLRRALEDVLARPLPPGCERPHNTLVPLRWDDAVVRRLLASERRRSRLRDALGADDPRWISGYVSVKEPASGALWWHQDWWCWEHPVSYRAAAIQVAVLVHLSDTTATRGAIRVLPGTHRRSVPLHAALPEAHGREAGELRADEPAMRDHPDQLTLAARAGDAVALDYRLLHGTHPNAGGERRASILLSFAPSWRGLPCDVRAHLIRHPALPRPEEREAATARATPWLPQFDGVARDLPLSRVAPSSFAVSG